VVSMTQVVFRTSEALWAFLLSLRQDRSADDWYGIVAATATSPLYPMSWRRDLMKRADSVLRR